MAKKITAEQVQNVLGAGYFDNAREIKDTDPLEPISMKLPIDQVDQYDNNPRKVKNPEYDGILESLRANGQDEALTITRRPDSEHYIIKRGGNTRLEIMKMLYHETGDERFAMIDCLFKPWTGEADCIVGHLTENTTQGKMTLIDKARGYRQFKIEYEKEQGIENLGQRKLAELLKQKGASINHRSLGIMNYALDVLEPAIPETLNRGLGKPQVEKLKRLHQTFERLAEAHDLYEPANRDAQIRAEFHQLLSDHDGDEWDIDLVIHEFTQRIGEMLEGKALYNRIKFDIEECLKRDPWKVTLVSTEQAGANDNLTEQSSDAQPALRQPAPQSPPPTSPPQQPATNNETLVKTQESQSEKNQSDDLTPQQREQQVARIEQGIKEQGGQSSPSIPRLEIPQTSLTAGEFDIKSQRARIFTLALQFANPHQLQRLLVPLNTGFGYFLDLPTPKFKLILDEQRTLQKDMEYRLVAKHPNPDRSTTARVFAWWLLFHSMGVLSYTGDTTAMQGFPLLPDNALKEHLASIYSLHPGLPQDRSPLMFSASTYIKQQTGEIHSNIDMALAYSYIKPAHMMKYIELLEARTQLQAYAEEHEINLWKEA